MSDMKVKAARVRTDMSTYRPHRLEILVDNFPKSEEMVYKTRKFGDVTVYFSEKNGRVSFVSHDPKNERGFGGAEFKYNIGTLTEPVMDIVRGPWSSNAEFMMKIFPYEIVDVSLTEDPQTFERGYTFYAMQVTLDVAIQAMELLPQDEGWQLIKTTIFPRVESYKSALEQRGLDPSTWEIGRTDCPTVVPEQSTAREDGLCTDSWHKSRLP